MHQSKLKSTNVTNACKIDQKIDFTVKMSDILSFPFTALKLVDRISMACLKGLNLNIISKFKVMKVFDLFYQGGPFFMGLVSLCAVVMFAFAAIKIVKVFGRHEYSKVGLDLILLFGSLAFMLGILGQAIGLFMAFSIIESAGDVSPSLIMGGLKVSMIAPLYGFFIFLISLLIWGLLREKIIRHLA